jgi:alkylation response protein AidB-like acyl-CoA dehydrogenase
MTDLAHPLERTLRAVGIEPTAFAAFLARVQEEAPRIDAASEFSVDLYRAGVDAGLLGILASEEGAPSIDDMRAAHETTERIAAVSPAVALWFAGTRLVAYLLSRFGRTETASVWLSQLRSGQMFGSFGITEPHAGSDVRGITTTARRVDGGYRLSGAKCWVGYAPVADVAIVLAKVDTEARDAATVALVVPMSDPGASGEQGPAISGFRGMPNGLLRFDDVFVPDGAALVVDGFLGMMNGLNYARIEAASYGVGIIRGSLESAAARAATREAYDGVIGDLQAIQAKLGRMYADYEASRRLVLDAAESYARANGGHQDLISAAKLFATDAARRASDEAMQVFGAAGLVIGSRVERLHRDSKITQIFDGTSEIHETMLGRRIVTALRRERPLEGAWLA